MLNSVQRRNDILRLVKRDGSVIVEQLVAKYDVSVETIRRDLRILDERGLVKRTYGGAAKREQTTWDMPFHERINLNRDRKETIAKEAIRLLEDGDSLFLDGNTTGYMISLFLPVDRQMMIVTNSLFVATSLLQRGVNSKVFLVGGEINEEGMTSGHKLQQELLQYRFDKAVISCMGVTASGTYFSRTEPMRVAHTVAEISSQIVLVADSSKMNRHAFHYGLDLKRFGVLITDSGCPSPLLEKFEQSIRRVVVTKGDESKGE
jgi:DeoR/GlpR family transcriptional regulator of sugar metabolism